MTAFVWNIFLALIWAAASEGLTAGNLALGFVLGYLILWFMQPAIGPSNYFRKVWSALRFVLFFLWEMIRANFRVALDVVTPAHRMRPGVIAVPLDASTDLEITFLANLIALTPGTLGLDISDDRRVLYVHAMYIEDVDAFRREIKNGFERRVLELLR